MLSIGFIEPHLKVCGGIRRILEVSNRLLKYGHKPIIFTPNGEDVKWFNNTVPIKKLQNIYDYKFDSCVFNLAQQFNICNVVKAKKKIFWVLAPEAYYKSPIIPIAALSQKFHLIANSAFTKNYIKRYVTVPYDITIIPGGINANHFRYDAAIEKIYHVLYYGSKRPWKGATIIKNAFTNTPQLKVIRMEGLNTKQEDMYKLYNSSIFYVSAGQAEGFSMPPLEAMACGCVVITSNEGGNMDFIKNGWNCILVKRNAMDIRKTVLNICKKVDIIEKLRYNGLLTAKQSKFDWDNITKKFIREIEK